jgi:hypothetical protein
MVVSRRCHTDFSSFSRVHVKWGKLSCSCPHHEEVWMYSCTYFETLTYEAPGIHRRLDGPQSHSGHFEEETGFLLMPQIEPQIIYLVAWSLYQVHYPG